MTDQRVLRSRFLTTLGFTGDFMHHRFNKRRQFTRDMTIRLAKRPITHTHTHTRFRPADPTALRVYTAQETLLHFGITQIPLDNRLVPAEADILILRDRSSFTAFDARKIV